jgi:hypothetical protein
VGKTVRAVIIEITPKDKGSDRNVIKDAQMSVNKIAFYGYERSGIGGVLASTTYKFHCIFQHAKDDM